MSNNGIILDAIDRNILDQLQRDGGISISELADRLNMTPPPCWRRVKRLKDAGILQRQVWLLDPEALGLSVTIFATVKLEAHDNQATIAFREGVKSLPEVLECYVLLGNIDALIKIVVPSIKYYEEFFYSRLSQIRGVREITSSVVMTEVKRTLELPYLT